MMHAKGFTLIELMVTVALVAILAGIGIPSFNSMIAQNRVVASINEFHSGLRLARSEAVKRSANVVLCASSNQATCTGTWSDGWLVFHDANGNGSVDSDEVIRVGSGMQAGYSLTFSSAATAITFLPRGMTNNQTGTFKLCDNGRVASRARGIILLTTGATRRSIDTNSSGIHEDNGGADFSC